MLDASNPANSVGSHGSAQQAAQAPTAITGLIDNFFMATQGRCDKVARIESAEGPMKTSPAAVTASTKPGFSDRKP